MSDDDDGTIIQQPGFVAPQEPTWKRWVKKIFHPIFKLFGWVK